MSGGGPSGVEGEGRNAPGVAITIAGIRGRDPGIRDHDPRTGDHDRQHGPEHPLSHAEVQVVDRTTNTSGTAIMKNQKVRSRWTGAITL
jgi:hypothetical protein